MRVVKFVLFFLCPSVVVGSHFRGAIFTWIPNANGTSLSISWRISWRRSSSSHFCNDTHIKSGSLIGGEGSLKCYSGCNDTIASLTYVCTDYSDTSSNDFSTGKNTVIYEPTSQQFTFGFTGCCWISTLNIGKDGSWSLLSSVDLTPREDTGKINTSPTVDLPPILHLQYGCNYTVRLPVADVDGDFIRCRWANDTQECDGICSALPPEATLNTTTCTLSYLPRQQLGYYAAAIQIEDFVSATSTTPLSSIPLQFLIHIYSGSDCNDVPTFLSPDDDACFAVDVGEQFSVTLKARNSKPLQRITTISGVGMVRSKEDTYQISSNYYRQLNVTWVPRKDDLGKIHRLCFYATDIRRITGNIRCVKIPVSLVGPTPLKVERVGISNTWIVTFDKTFKKPTEPAYLEVFETDTSTEIFSVDASTSPDVKFDTDMKQVKVSFNYSFDVSKDYYVTIPSGFVKGHVGCGALSVAVNDSSFWTIKIDCGRLKAPTNGFISLGLTTFGSTATYSCRSGYIAVGSNKRECMENGSWSYSNPTCVIADCGPLDDPTNGEAIYTKTTFPSKAFFTCHDGFFLEGPETVICTSQGVWRLPTPSCLAKDCGELKDPNNGKAEFTSTTFGAEALFRCSEGFIIDGTETVNCTANGTWSLSTPFCIKSGESSNAAVIGAVTGGALILLIIIVIATAAAVKTKHVGKLCESRGS